MRPASLMLLAVVTAAAVAVAISLNAVRGTGGADSAHGEAFVPGLVEHINEVDRIEIDDRTGQTVLVRKGDGFAGESGYPARVAVIRDLLTQLSVLTIEERKTDRPERYPELSLAEPSAETDASRHVRVLADGKPLVDVYIGKAESSVGGTRGGLYARREGEARTWLLRGAVELPGARAGWFDNELLDIKADELRSVTLKTPEGEVTLQRDEGSDRLTMQNVPADRVPEEGRVRQLAGMLTRLKFADLRKAGEGAASGGVVTAITRDGLTIRVVEVALDEAAKARWVRVSVEGGEGADDKRLVELRRRVEGYEFELRGVNAELLGTKTTAFLALP
ncbi:MAG: DUF4340 domain-containing protein [Burkholderiaceae bacterium]